jgi:hypothetical protein
MRICSKCRTEKPESRDHFSFIKSRQKWHAWCKPCCAEARRLDRYLNPARYAEIERKRIEKNGEERREANRRRWAERSKIYRENSAKRRKEMQAAYVANRRRRIESDPTYAAKVSEQRRATFERHGSKYNAQRRKAWETASAQKKIRTYFTSAICHSLKGSTKGGRSWESILGYTANDLRAHLERQFARGMSWDNYGDWHVDHIVPVVQFSFDSADDPEFRACWALTNLRPLWAKANLSKNRRRTHLI